MYEEYFALKRKPFSIVPDPSYFFMSEGHKEGLAHLLYGIQNEGGFVLLTGEVGTGKTTVCRRLLELIPEDVEVAFILNPKVTALELLATICDEFGIEYPKKTTSIKVLVSRINDYLIAIHEKGRRAVLIIEEAQNLDSDVLEQIRLLTNLETNEKKLLQMIMLGQPELRRMLLKPQLRQLSQRITARYHLGPLRKEEVPKYVEHRLTAAGLVRGKLFPPRTLDKLVRLTGGVPRLINVICDRALLGAYVQEKNRVDVKTLKQAAREVFGEEHNARSRWFRYRYAALAFILLILVVSGALVFNAAVVKNTVVALRTVVDRDTAKGVPVSAAKIVGTPKEPTGAPDLFTGEATVRAWATLERPPGRSGAELREAAYRVIAGQWGFGYSTGKGDGFCSQAKASGLECLADRGGMIDLRRMNRPAMLTLVDEKGGKYYAALTALRNDAATFQIGDETRIVPLKEIAGWWAGEYMLLWRPPPHYDAALKPGRTGAVVAWLADRLAALSGGGGSTAGATRYDRNMVERVKQFQLTHDTVPDGIVGPRTIIGLTAVLPDGDPMLSKPGGGG